MVPTVMLTAHGLHVLVPGDDDIVVPSGDYRALSEALRRVADRHDVSGRIVLVPERDLPHGGLIAAMDAAREPGFPYVTVAGGAM